MTQPSSPVVSEPDPRPIRTALGDKYRDELDWWTAWLDSSIIPWARGDLQILWGRESPNLLDPTPQEAILRLREADRTRYPDILKLDLTRDYGWLLDIGCGPLVPATVFRGRVFGVDPILGAYREAGFPVDEYGALLLPHAIEDLWMVPSDTFNTVIAINSLNHVDDFEQAISELERVARPGALLRLETEYHEPTLAEPHLLDDQRVQAAFRRFGVQKIDQRQWGETVSTTWST